MNTTQPVTIIVGPTAAGKTAAGIALARSLSGAVLSADSRQVYSYLDIGTAKPTAAHNQAPHSALTPETIESVPHYLLNRVAPNEPYTLSDWQQDAHTTLAALTHAGQAAIVVGGTMLYVDSLVYNYDIPAVPPNETVRKELAQQPTHELYARLLAQDPAAKHFIEPDNVRRIIRALEVMAATGTPFSSQRTARPPRFTYQLVGIFPGWDALEEMIAARAQAMIDEGLLEEVARLRQQYSPTCPLLTTLNYRQAAAVLDGTLSKAEAVAEMTTVTLRYGKRQMRWWNRRTDITWVDTPSLAAIQRGLSH